MPYHTLEITTNRQNLLNTIQQNWRDSATSDETEQFLIKMFPGANKCALVWASAGKGAHTSKARY